MAQLLALLAASIVVPAAATASPRTQGTSPNVVILMADDLGYADIGCYGAATIATPRIDAMAGQGVKLTSFYVRPSCSPTRAAILTGSVPQRVGVVQPLSQWGEFGLNGAEETIAERLVSVGYATGYFGKWHLGDSPDQLPGAQGFQDVLSNPWGHLADPSAYVDSQSAQWEWDPDARFDTQRFTARTIEFIQQSNASQTPFFCILSYTAPHYPAVASPAFQGTSADGRDYGDAVEELDASVGQVLDVIDTLGIQNDTLVIFLSDNGPAFGQGAYQAGSAGVLRGSKGSTFEGGIRVPFVARMTGTLASGATIDAPAADVDLMPTILGLAGASLPQGVVLDGVDTWPQLLGQPGSQSRQFFHMHQGELEAIRVGDFKLRNGELFDLVADPGETTDVAASHPGIVGSLTVELGAFAQDLAANSRPLGRQQRLISDWRGEVGLPSGTTMVDGDLWTEVDQGVAPWVVDDQDPVADFERVTRVGPGPTNLPPMVIRQSTPNADLRFTRGGTSIVPGAAFSAQLWTRSLETTPSTELVLLDVGDEFQGLSITVGNGGVIGDDGGPGRSDDLRVRLGGWDSIASQSITLDLPSEWTDSMVHVAFSYDAEGVVSVYLQGRLAHVEPAPFGGVLWGGDRDWALFGRSGELGAAGGFGPLPFDSAGGFGDLAGFGLRDRALTRAEVERQYARYAKYPYCSGRPSIAGTRAELDFFGSFLLSDDALEVELEGLPPGTFGYLIASESQGRVSISNGYVCLGAPIYRLAGQIAQASPTGSASFGLDRMLAPAQLNLLGATPVLNFQFWFRDGAGSNFSNGLNVTFSP